jgi:pimeloyl-ACP methyl ester carboxylesterase
VYPSRGADPYQPGSAFRAAATLMVGGFVALTYAALFPDHPGGIILANTTGGQLDHQASIEIFRRLGGYEAAHIAARDFAELTEESGKEFLRVCFPLFSSKPGFAEEARQWRAVHPDPWTSICTISGMRLSASTRGPSWPASPARR